MADGLVVMLTALNLEYEAVRDTLTDLRVHRHAAGTRFEVGRLRDGAGRVALALAGKGNHPAAVLTERAIAEFSPAALLFVGVAGALRPSVDLGDVVVATHVYAYHGGTSRDDGMKARPRGWEIAHGPDQLARHVARNDRWRRRLPDGADPKVRFGAIAAGEVVQDSTLSGHAEWLRQHYNDALAIEMEAAGVAQAGHLNALPVVVVRGISDRADGTKLATDGARWQPRAAAHAAAFAAALATDLIEDAEARGTTAAPEGAGARGPTAAAGDAAARGTIAAVEDAGARRITAAEPVTAPSHPITWNVATGNATVGVQAGVIHGDVHLGSRSAGAPAVLPAQLPALRSQLSGLRDELRLVFRSGHLDEPTYAAAARELDAATAALASGAAGGPDAAMLALKKLRGLLADLSDLATRVTALLAAIRGLC
jgi:adenosylhomocysteine nucleosidase